MRRLMELFLLLVLCCNAMAQLSESQLEKIVFEMSQRKETVHIAKQNKEWYYTVFLTKEYFRSNIVTGETYYYLKDVLPDTIKCTHIEAKTLDFFER